MDEKSIDKFAYEALKAFALTHNYNKWIFDSFRPYIGKNVLEIGCGIGNITRYLVTACETLIGIDTSETFLKHLKIDHPDLELYNFDVSDAGITKLSDKNIDTVVCINVLEHIKDDVATLQNMFNLLKPEGHLLLFVPALDFLYNVIDKNVNHYRRYNRKDLIKKLESVGFKITKSYFSNYIGVFGWFINGNIFRRKDFPVLQPILFDKLVPIISKMEKCVKLPFGMNLIIIASKP